MKYYGATDIGNFREKNEDYFYMQDGLYIVADGMGGHRAGEIASKLSIDIFVKSLTGKIKKTSGPAGKSIKKTIFASVRLANDEVFRQSMSNAEYYGMGTTFTACFIHKDTAYIAHIGDSRLYLYRNNELELLTSDHTFVGELFRRGEITYAETFDHPQRNFLTNVLGVADEVTPDYLTLKILPGDILTLCSDGLNSMLRDDQISRLIAKHQDPKDSVTKLIESALKKGGNDNITVIVVKI